MNPPSSFPATASHSSRSVPPFRSYISVELPFTLPPTVTCSSAAVSQAHKQAASDGLAGEDKQRVEAFLPPSFVVKCLQHAVPQNTSGQPGDPVSRSGKRRNSSSTGGTADQRDLGDDVGSRSSSSSSTSDSTHSGSDSSSDGRNEGDAEQGRSTGARAQAGAAKPPSDGQKSELHLRTRHRRDYCTDPIFSGWRSTNWGVNDDHADDEGDLESRRDEPSLAASQLHVRAQKRRRREVFPSLEPQLLVHGYYRSDLLVRVRRRRRLRRLRDSETGEVLREEPCSDADEEVGEGSEGSSVRRLPSVTAEVVGVVSRELELARPADFAFSLFTPEQLHAFPALCGADSFPPAHFLTAKAPYEVRYEPGREANETVVFTSLAAAGEVAGATPLQQQVLSPVASLSATAAAQTMLGPLPSIAVVPEETRTPPARLPAHEDYLRNLPSSLDGRSIDDPPEVRMLVHLLDARPAWIVHDLADAMLQSGVCPRSYRNKQVMNCFSYVIRSGPFNRLRLRLDYDPYASSASAPYERIAIRLHRRSDIGVRLRDVSRSPHITSVLRLLLERDRVRRLAYKAEPGHARRATLLELQCRPIREGLLAQPYQLVDAMDDPVVAELMRNVPVVDTPMELAQRGQRRGWLSDAAYTRAMTYFAESLAQLLEQEVEPLLRKFKGEVEAEKKKRAVAGGRGGGAGGVGQPAQTALSSAASQANNTNGADEEEDADEDEENVSSAMSSATAGNVSDRDESEED